MTTVDLLLNEIVYKEPRTAVRLPECRAQFHPSRPDRHNEVELNWLPSGSLTYSTALIPLQTFLASVGPISPSPLMARITRHATLPRIRKFSKRYRKARGRVHNHTVTGQRRADCSDALASPRWFFPADKYLLQTAADSLSEWCFISMTRIFFHFPLRKRRK